MLTNAAGVFGGAEVGAGEDAGGADPAEVCLELVVLTLMLL